MGYIFNFLIFCLVHFGYNMLSSQTLGKVLDKTFLNIHSVLQFFIESYG